MKVLLPVVLLLTSMFGAMVSFPAYSSSGKEGNVHGTVIDEDGNALQGVKVVVYSSSSIIDTNYTNTDGLFRFALDSGSYTFTFEKEGYLTSDKEISVPEGGGFRLRPEDDPVKLGDMVLKKALKMSASVLSRVVEPGNEIQFPFTVSNIGEKPEDAQFSVVNSAGWETKVLDSTGEIKRVLLATSSSLNLYLEVDIPSGAEGTSVVSLTAVGKTNATLEFTIISRPNLAHDIEMTSSFPFVSVELGRTITYPLVITNHGETNDTVYLMGTAPEGWTIRFQESESTQMDVLSLYLPSGQSKSLTVEVDHPDDAQLGEYNLVVSAVSEDGEVRDSLNLKVRLTEVTSNVKVISAFTDVTAEAGKVIQYPITIWNKGDTDVLFLLTVLSAPENWKIVFLSEDVEVSSLLVTADESVSLKLKVTPPSVVETGNYKIVIGAESDDGVFTKQIELKANVAGSYELAIGLSTLYTTVTTGESTTFTAKITNEGQSPVTTLYVDATAAEDWEVLTTPVQVASLAPKESATFNIVVKNPSDTVAGDYLITLKASSDQVESEETQIRVTAQASTSWGFIGLGAVVVVIIGLIIVFMKFKRR